MLELEEKLAKIILNERERKLLPLLFTGDVEPEVMKELTADLDVEKDSLNYMLMLSHLGYRYGWENFPKEAVPRLQGFHRFYHAKNIVALPFLLRQIRKLHFVGIPVMLVKGLAVFAHYAVHIPRMMGDYDFAVPAKCFDLTMDILNSSKDVIFHSEARHSVTFHSTSDKVPLGIDVHHRIFKHEGNDERDIWKRAVKINFFGCEVLVPCRKDMLFHQLDNQCRNFFVNEFPERRMKWLFDIRCVIGDEPADLNFLVEQSRVFRNSYRIRLMLMLFSVFFPDVINSEEVNRVFCCDEAKYEKWLALNLKIQLLAKQHQNNHKKYGMRMRYTPWYAAKLMYMHYLRFLSLREEELCEEDRNFRKFILKELKVHSEIELIRKYWTRLSWKCREEI